MPNSPYTIRLEDDLRKSLELEAEREGRPAAQLAVRAIRSMIEAKTVKRAAIDASVEMAETGRFISSDAMTAWIASWDSDDELTPPDADIFPDDA